MNSPADTPDSGGIGLSPEQFDAAFPFHFAIDRSLVIVQAGRALRRTCPDAVAGVALAGVFSLKEPEIPLAFDALQFAAQAVCLWQHKDSGLILRGQFLPAQGGEYVVFLGLPLQTAHADFSRSGRMPDDLALCTPSMDPQQVLPVPKIAFRDFPEQAGEGSERGKANEALNRQLRFLAESRAQLQHKTAETQKLALIASLTDNAVVLSDAEGRVEWVNEGFVRITGYTLEEMLGKKPGAVLQGERTDRAVVAYMREQLGKGEGFTAQLLNYAKSGREYWIHIEVRPIHDEHGNITNFMAIERDITPRKQTEQALMDAKREAEAASQAKSAFLAAMSHEIRSPMNAVLGTLELLRSSALDCEQQIWAKAAYDSAHALLKIIDNILDFSKIEAGKLVLQEVGFRLESLLNDIIQLFRPHAEAKGLSLGLSMAPDTPQRLRGDPFRLRQIFVNLIGNAMKFTDRGRIEVAVSALNRSETSVHLEFHVRDTGIGIPREAVDSLFQEFAQFEAPSPRHYGGTGLGLAICRRLADLMEGEIGVDSTPGRGSDFWFRVWLDIDPAAEIAPPPEEHPWIAEAHAKTLGRILLAEDGEVNRLVITTMLGKAGYEVAAVHDGRAAVEAASRNDYDLILMDVQMPVMDGHQAARAIRALPGRRAQVPIVALTANALLDNRDACLAAGMDDFITKPVDRGKLLASIAQWLQSRSGPEAGLDTAGLAPILDQELLKTLIENTDVEVMRQTVQIFFEECDLRLPRMAEANEIRDLAGLKAESHTLQSGAQLIGAVRLADTARDLEEACRRNDTVLASALLGKMRLLVDESRQIYEKTVGFDDAG